MNRAPTTLHKYMHNFCIMLSGFDIEKYFEYKFYESDLHFMSCAHFLMFIRFREREMASFNVHGTVHRNSMSINVQQDAAVQFVLSVNCSTCFGWVFRPSSGAQITLSTTSGRARLKHDGTCAETRFGLSAQRTSPFKSAGGVSSVDCWQPRCAASAVVMLDTPRSEVV